MAEETPPVIQRYIFNIDSLEQGAKRADQILDQLERRATKVLNTVSGAGGGKGFANTESAIETVVTAIESLEDTVQTANTNIGVSFNQLGERIENAMLAALNAVSQQAQQTAQQAQSAAQQANSALNSIGTQGVQQGAQQATTGLAAVEAILARIGQNQGIEKRTAALLEFKEQAAQFGTQFQHAAALADQALDPLTNTTGTLEERLNRAASAAKELESAAAAIGTNRTRIQQFEIERRQERIGEIARQDVVEGEDLDELKRLNTEIRDFQLQVRKLGIEQKVARDGAQTLNEQYASLRRQILDTGQAIRETATGFQVFTPTKPVIDQTKLIQAQEALALAEQRRTATAGLSTSAIDKQRDAEEKLFQVREKRRLAETKFAALPTGAPTSQFTASLKEISGLTDQETQAQKAVTKAREEAARAGNVAARSSVELGEAQRQLLDVERATGTIATQNATITADAATIQTDAVTRFTVANQEAQQALGNFAAAGDNVSNRQIANAEKLQQALQKEQTVLQQSAITQQQHANAVTEAQRKRDAADRRVATAQTRLTQAPAGSREETEAAKELTSALDGATRAENALAIAQRNQANASRQTAVQYRGAVNGVVRATQELTNANEAGNRPAVRVHDRLLALLAVSRLLPGPLGNVTSGLALMSGVAFNAETIMLGVAGAILAAGVAAFRAGQEFNKNLNQIRAQSEGLGLTINEVKAFDFVLSQTGGSIENFAVGIKKINQAITGIGPEARETKDLLESIFAGNLKISSNTRTVDVIKALAKESEFLEKSGLGAAVAGEIFGRSWDEVKGRFKDLAEQLEAAEELIRRTGVASEESVKTAKEYALSVAELDIRWQKLINTLKIPVIANIVVKFTDDISAGLEKLLPFLFPQFAPPGTGDLGLKVAKFLLVDFNPIVGLLTEVGRLGEKAPLPKDQQQAKELTEALKEQEQQTQEQFDLEKTAIGKIRARFEERKREFEGIKALGGATGDQIKALNEEEVAIIQREIDLLNKQVQAGQKRIGILDRVDEANSKFAEKLRKRREELVPGGGVPLDSEASAEVKKIDEDLDKIGKSLAETGPGIIEAEKELANRRIQINRLKKTLSDLQKDERVGFVETNEAIEAQREAIRGLIPGSEEFDEARQQLFSIIAKRIDFLESEIKLGRDVAESKKEIVSREKELNRIRRQLRDEEVKQELADQARFLEDRRRQIDESLNDLKAEYDKNLDEARVKFERGLVTISELATLEVTQIDLAFQAFGSGQQAILRIIDSQIASIKQKLSEGLIDPIQAVSKIRDLEKDANRERKELQRAEIKSLNDIRQVEFKLREEILRNQQRFDEIELDLLKRRNERRLRLLDEAARDSLSAARLEAEERARIAEQELDRELLNAQRQFNAQRETFVQAVQQGPTGQRVFSGLVINRAEQLQRINPELIRNVISEIADKSDLASKNAVDLLEKVLQIQEARAGVRQEKFVALLDLEFRQQQEINNILTRQVELRETILDIEERRNNLLGERGLVSELRAGDRQIEIDRERLKLLEASLVALEREARLKLSERVSRAEAFVRPQAFRAALDSGSSPAEATKIAEDAAQKFINEFLNGADFAELRKRALDLRASTDELNINLAITDNFFTRFSRGLEKIQDTFGQLPEPFDKLQFAVRGLQGLSDLFAQKEARRVLAEKQRKEELNLKSPALKPATPAELFQQGVSKSGSLILSAGDQFKSAVQEASTDIVKALRDSGQVWNEAVTDSTFTLGGLLLNAKPFVGAPPSLVPDLGGAGTLPVDSSRDAQLNAQQKTNRDLSLSTARLLGASERVIEELFFFESTFKTFAKSPTGPRGVPQFTTGTGRDEGLVINRFVDERVIPEKAIPAGVKHFLKLLEHYKGDYVLALTAYNQGRGLVDKFVKFKELRGETRDLNAPITKEAFPFTKEGRGFAATILSRSGIPTAQSQQAQAQVEQDTTQTAIENTIRFVILPAIEKELKEASEKREDRLIKDVPPALFDQLKPVLDQLRQQGFLVEIKVGATEDAIRLTAPQNVVLPVGSPPQTPLGFVPPVAGPGVGQPPVSAPLNISSEVIQKTKPSLVSSIVSGIRSLGRKIGDMFRDPNFDAEAKKVSLGKRVLAGVLGAVNNLISGLTSETAGGKVAGIGGAVGDVVGTFAPFAGAVIGQVAGTIGGIFDFVGGIFRKRAEKIADGIQEDFKTIMAKFRDGALTLGESVQELQSLANKARTQLSGGKIGKKGGRAQLVQIESQIQDQIAELRRQAKEIQDRFQQQLKDLRLPPELRSVASSIREAFQQVKEFLRSFEDPAKALEHLADAREFLDRTLTELQEEAFEDLKTLLKREVEAERSFQKERLAIINEGRLQSPFQQAQDRLARLFELEKKRAEERASALKEQESIQGRISLLEKAFSKADSIIDKMRRSFEGLADRLDNIFRGGLVDEFGRRIGGGGLLGESRGALSPLAGVAAGSQVINSSVSLQFNISAGTPSLASQAGRSIENTLSRLGLINPGASRLNLERPFSG